MEMNMKYCGVAVLVVLACACVWGGVKWNNMLWKSSVIDAGGRYAAFVNAKGRGALIADEFTDWFSAQDGSINASKFKKNFNDTFDVVLNPNKSGAWLYLKKARGGDLEYQVNRKINAMIIDSSLRVQLGGEPPVGP